MAEKQHVCGSSEGTEVRENQKRSNTQQQIKLSYTQTGSIVLKAIRICFFSTSTHKKPLNCVDCYPKQNGNNEPL
ncbi:hypothetical protein Anapl_08741 [Anas platyrhynchos]|uniref:Uncharacterized protein n=1 Tax=Anas platyrhynchos TaxID=8839 RepID=R0LIT0_ANAPL|nr:hypothetical protein Anapl_08741 [Anas platyrhynchos]